MLNLILEVLQRFVAFLDRRRGAVLVGVAVAVLVAGSTGAAILRPPFLVPVLDAVEGTLLTLLSQPARLNRWFTTPRVSSGEMMELELELAELREARAENQRLRRMLDYESPSGRRTVPGRVVGLDLDPIRGVAWIDVGSRRGLRGGEPVLTTEGLVGVVEETMPRRSRIRLLRNHDTPVGVRDTRSRVLGVLEWNPGDAELEVSYVPKQADVAEGDTLISSGLGEVFPAGLPVGVVTEVRDPPERLLKEIKVRTFGSFYRLEEVFVLLPLGEAMGDSLGAGAAGEER